MLDWLRSETVWMGITGGRLVFRYGFRRGCWYIFLEADDADVMSTGGAKEGCGWKGEYRLAMGLLFAECSAQNDS